MRPEPLGSCKRYRWHFPQKWTLSVGGARLTPSWRPVRGGTFRQACASTYRILRSRDEMPVHAGQLSRGWRRPSECAPTGGPAPEVGGPILVQALVGLIPLKACATSCSSDQRSADWTLTPFMRRLPMTPSWKAARFCENSKLLSGAPLAL